VASAAVTSAAAVKASAATAVETATSMKAAAEAGLPARGEASRNSSMIKAAERARMTAGLNMRRRRSVLRSCESMLWGCKSMLLG